jgi:crossover junction endodeoxyribonuclease RusA
MYSLTLPFPPSLNHYLRRTPHGVYQTPEAVAYKEEAAYTARLAGVQPLEGEVVVVLDVYRPAKRGDLDNYAKLALDAMNRILWHDDSQIVEIHAHRFDDKHNPRVEISAWAKGHKDD